MNGRTSRRKDRLSKVRKVKKKLWSRWLEANEQGRERLKILYEEIKTEVPGYFVEIDKIDQKREKKNTKKGFTKDSLDFHSSMEREILQKGRAVH